MHRNIRKDLTDIDEIIKVFQTIDDFSTMKEFFDEIFTEPERHDLALRWQLMKRLYAKVPQRKIALALGVSLCKITRGAKIINNRKSIAYNILSSKPL